MQAPKSSPRGTYDLLPSESNKWALVENMAKKLLNSAGFSEIRTPIFESTEIFARAAGETSDIVNKEMYTFLDRSERSITLRPEGTAGVVRAFLSNGLDKQPKPLKLWYLGPMFRYERSQTGRYRQFTQLGLEIFGSSLPEAELEGIHLALNLFNDLGLKNLSLEINSVGDNSSREAYQKAMQEFLEKHYLQICPDCQKRSKTNPLRALDCKIPQDQALYQAEAPKIKNYLNTESLVHQEKLISLLNFFQISFTQNQNLVRGLDYYTKTVFEIKTTDPVLGVQNTICAGGRYDNLVQEFGGSSTPAFGWALGMERLMILFNQNAIQELLDFAIVYPISYFNEAFALADKLRQKGFKVNIEYKGYESKSQSNKMFERASKVASNLILYKPEENIFAQIKTKLAKNTYKTEQEFWESL